VMKELIQYGRVLRPWIGIRYVTAESPTAMDPATELLQGPPAGRTTPQGAGVVVEQVLQGSPADQAGLRKGDVIRRLDANPVGGSEDVYAFMARHSPGQRVQVTVERKGHTAAVTLHLGQKPPDAGALFRR